MKEQFETIVDQYTTAFCINYNLEPYDRRMWGPGGIGTYALIAYHVINFNDIRYCIDNNLSWDDFESWYNTHDTIVQINELLSEHDAKSYLSCPPLSVWCSEYRQAMEDNIKKWNEQVLHLNELTETFINDIEQFVASQ